MGVMQAATARINQHNKLQRQLNDYNAMVDQLRRNLQVREDCRQPVHVSTETRRNAMLNLGTSFMHEGWLQHIEFKSLGGGVWLASIKK